MANFMKSCVKLGADVIISPAQQIYAYHFKDYKNNGKDTKEMRNRRAEESKQIQKDKRYEEFLKLRNVDGIPSACDDYEATYFSLDECVKCLNSSAVNLQMQALLKLKINIIREASPVIDAVIEAGILSQLQKFLKNDKDEALQYEATSVIKLIATGTEDHVRSLVDAGYEETLLNLLQTKEDDIAEEAIWALGFIAADYPIIKKFKVALGIARMPLLNEPSLSLMRAITWTMSSLQQSKRRLFLVYEENFLSLIVKVLTCPDHDEDVLKSILQELTSVTIIYNDNKIDTVLQTNGVVNKLVDLLDVDDISIVLLSLRALTIIASGKYAQSKTLVDGNALPALGELFSHPRAIVQRTAVKCVQFISNHMREQVAAIMECNLVPLLIDTMKKSEAPVILSAIKILGNIVLNEEQGQFATMLHAGAIQAICQALTTSCPDCVSYSIMMLRSILTLASSNNQLEATRSIIKTHGLNAIKNCRSSKRLLISHCANSLIEEHFSDEIVDLVDHAVQVD